MRHQSGRRVTRGQGALLNSDAFAGIVGEDATRALYKSLALKRGKYLDDGLKERNIDIERL
eukprot:9784609-Lingulodinium_polyedra.AAC.1